MFCRIYLVPPGSGWTTLVFKWKINQQIDTDDCGWRGPEDNAGSRFSLSSFLNLLFSSMLRDCVLLSSIRVDNTCPIHPALLLQYIFAFE